MSFPAYPVTDRQKKIVAIARDLSETFGKRAAEYDWAGKFPFENYKDLHQADYLTLTVPQELGGWGANVLEVTLGQLQLAQGCASTALVVSMHLLNIARIQEVLKSDMYTRICRAVVEDGAIFNSAISEPVTGSPSRGGRPATTARRQADGSWRITGRKTYTTGSFVLKLIAVGCSIVDEASEDSNLPPLKADRGSFLVPGDAPGLRIEETWDSLSMRSSASNDLVLEDVSVGPDAYMGTMSATPAVAAWGLTTAAVYAGIAEAARDEAIDFARNRRPNSLNRSIGTLPHIQEKIGQMELALLQSRAVLLGVVAQYVADQASVPASQLSAAKYLAVNNGVAAVDLAMRVVGAASLSLDSPLQRHYRDIRAGLHNPPMDDVTLTQLAKDALGPLD